MKVMRQLGREDWVKEGIALLAGNGWRDLRVASAARRLGVTKGSFYWHFHDRDDWCLAILSYWEHRVFAGLVRPSLGRGAEDLALGRAVADWAAAEMPAARAMGRVRRESSLSAGTAPREGRKSA